MDDVGTLGNVNTIEEFTDILMADQGGLVNVRTGLCNNFDIVTREVDFVLVILWLFKGNGSWDWDVTNALFTEEVTDFEVAIFTSNRDWEVICDQLHLVEETLGDADHHVTDVGDDGTCASKCSTVTLPDLDLDTLGVHGHLHVDVVERLGKGTTWTENGNGTTRDLDADYCCVRGRDVRGKGRGMRMEKVGCSQDTLDIKITHWYRSPLSDAYWADGNRGTEQEGRSITPC